MMTTLSFLWLLFCHNSHIALNNISLWFKRVVWFIKFYMAMIMGDERTCDRLMFTEYEPLFDRQLQLTSGIILCLSRIANCSGNSLGRLSQIASSEKFIFSKIQLESISALNSLSTGKELFEALATTQEGKDLLKQAFLRIGLARYTELQADDIPTVLSKLKLFVYEGGWY